MYRLIEFGMEDTGKYAALFLSLTEKIYKGDKNYSERRSDTVKWLSGAHAGADFLRQKNLLVMVGDVPAARGIVFINEIGGFGSIGFFESVNDEKAVSLIVDAAKSFCKENDIKTIYAPMNGSIWSAYRLMTKGFEEKPFMGEPYNKPYYRDLLMKCGFESAKTWETQYIKKVAAKGNNAERYKGINKTQHKKGIKVRSMKDFDEDIRVVYRLAMNSFAKFYLFHEIDEETFFAMYEDMKLICDKRTIKLAYNEENEPIGFAIALPDYQSKLGFLFKYTGRYIFLYLGTLQKDGESVYPQASKAMIVPIMKSLFFRRKGYFAAMMSEDAKTRTFAESYENVRQYELFKLEVN